MTALHWTFARLGDLKPLDVYDLLNLRAVVFIVEQDCVFLDPDDADPVSWHLLGRNAGGDLQAYLRIVDAGVKYPQPSIGRVVTAPSARGSNLGRAVMAEGIARCNMLYPALGIVINAQQRLEPFYRSYQFESRGECYIEDGIPHIEMARAVTSANLK